MPRLRRSNLAKPGFTRRPDGGFAGKNLTAADRDRAEALVIPPAWTDVWIAPHANSHIQATGVDDAGRRQYIYHEQWRETKDKAKFNRALDLAAALPGARRTVTRDLRTAGMTRERALAASFRMLDTGALRIGSERYAQTNGSHGLSTLLCSHAKVSGQTIALAFPAKSGHEWSSEITDADLASVIRSLKRRGPNARLLAWRDGDDWHPVAADEVNDYVRECTGGEFTAKDFRTLRGTIAAAESLAAHGPERTRTGRQRALAQAMRDAAESLGNTPAIAKKSYVDPRIVSLYKRGRTIEKTQGSSDAALRRLLVG
jgi:DNA topoisomerase-1